MSGALCAIVTHDFVFCGMLNRALLRLSLRPCSMARRTRGVRFDDAVANRNFRKETLMPVVASDWFKSLTIRTDPGVAEVRGTRS